MNALGSGALIKALERRAGKKDARRSSNIVDRVYAKKTIRQIDESGEKSRKEKLWLRS
jgi:hypothetical protein